MKYLSIPALLISLLTLGLVLTSSVQAPPSGATPGDDFLNLKTFLAGERHSGLLATSSVADATLNANDIKLWSAASLVTFAPGIMAGVTLTLPASSTLPSFLGKAGDRQPFCVQNSTSTANIPITFAGGLGTKLLVASSSVSALGSVKLYPGKIGCFSFIRESATTTARDFSVILNVYN